MPTVRLTYGLPGSGKTTWAREEQRRDPNVVVVCKDDLRAMLNNGKWSRENEKLILYIRDEIIKSALSLGRNVIVADTNLDPKHFAHIKELVNGGAKVERVYFDDVSLEECIARDLKRPNSIGEAVIRKMYRQYLAPKTNAPAKRHNDPTLPYAYISDMDGTLALLNGRDPYNASTCENDLINVDVAMTLRNARGVHKLIIVSARSDKYRPETERWLDGVGIYHDLLLMRKEGDNRKDAIIKEELYREHIEGKYNVTGVFDDRNSVVELWRSLGLTCFQVADGDF